MTTSKTSLLLLSLMAGVPAACAGSIDAGVRREFTEVHMGMPVRVVLFAPSDDAARLAARAAFARIAQLEDIFSDYRSTSELRLLDSRPLQWNPVSEPLFDLLTRAVHIARATDGAFDPTAGPLTSLWREARAAGKLPEPIALDSARQLTGWQLLHFDSAQRAVRLDRAHMRLDLGAIAKGFILQSALQTLRRHHISSALLEAGGDIVVSDPPPGRTGWLIHTTADDTAFARRAASLHNAALATSGPTFQYLDDAGTRHSHVLDPRTGRALTSSATTHVIAPDAATADALATAISVLGPASVPALRRFFPGLEVSVR